MIVDAHTHLLPERLAAKIRQFFTAHIAAVLPYAWEYDQARAQLAAAGVQRCWSLPYAHKAGVASSLNRWMAETFTGDAFVVPGATLHPGDDVESVLAEALDELDLRILKLHCSVGGFAADDPRLAPLWRRVSEEGSPVVVHVGHAVDGSTAGDELAPVARVAAAWPAARLIVAHSGAPAVAETLALLRAHPALHADLTPVVHATVPVESAMITGLEDRLLFGSDVPNVVVPVGAVMAQVRAWGLPADKEAAILGGNALRLERRA